MLDTVRVYEIAEEAGTSSQDVIAKAKDLGIELKSPQTAVSYEDAEEITFYILTGKSSKLKYINLYKNKFTELERAATEISSKQMSIIDENIKETFDLFIKGKSQEKKKIIPSINNKQDNEKKDITLNSYPSVTIEINNLKSIKYLKWELQKEKGVYGIIGENGIGKSSLLISIAKLVNGGIFQSELIGVGNYDDAKITYTINDKKINFIKNESTSNNWRQEETDLYTMPKIKGFFESSILSGTRFNKINSYIKDKLEYIENEDIISKSPEFVINEMNYILYGNSENLYKFNELYEIKATRKHQRSKNDKTLFERNYKYCALKIKENKYLKEQTFSTGEYFLLQILKFISLFTKTNHIIPPLIIIDEIELSLHPLAQQRLINKLNEFSKLYNLIVIFATHSLHVIENIEDEKRFYIKKSSKNEIKIENNVEIGYLTSKLYKHQFFDYIFLVEDKMAKKYLKLTINELKKENSDLLNKDYEIISTGGADKVFEVNRDNDKYKYFGNAIVISIPDEDKKEMFDMYEHKGFTKIYIPISPNIETYIHNKYKNNEVSFITKFEDFINDKYYSEIKKSFSFEFKEKKSKNFVKDICCKIVTETEDSSTEDTLLYSAKKHKEELVDFIYNENKNEDEHKKFIGFLKNLLNTRT
ncbi:translation initiation factor IF-2 N-terminal domain-containing protein [Aliarcobacter butzleri]|uniref:translation initiation factor IF-2 N-terminal domain-containing protein n=1 Tax=Aliarcobacter butzleri TaxID=28197 RepID=UPI0021B211EB|nr:translation initiation factor IF-2 N-terminal domain-containing protein [Aliarcobacter butzleri]MCT7547326.1 translation initiation factor IF-2 N-terminal domain-containing protein [Aliarcobacter butzleri]